MNLKNSKLFFIMGILVFSISFNSGCTDKIPKTKSIEIIKSESTKENKDKYIEINNQNANSISFENGTEIKIEDGDISNNNFKIKNKGNFYASKINIRYIEIDKSKITTSKSSVTLDMTLNSGEISYIAFANKKHTKRVKITDYSYIYRGNKVYVNLEDNSIKIEELKSQLKDSSPYEVLIVSEPQKISEYHDSEKGSTYSIKIKNTSNSELGNTVIKLAELNIDNEYTNIISAVYNSVLKSQEEAQVSITTSKTANSLEIIGYDYDDPKAKSNIYIDIKSHIALLNK